MAKELVGGSYCRRARHFTDFSLPSQAVLQHRDIDVSVIYKFCVLAMDLGDVEAHDELRDAQTKRRKSSSGGEARKRSRRQ